MFSVSMNDSATTIPKPRTIKPLPKKKSVRLKEIKSDEIVISSEDEESSIPKPGKDQGLGTQPALPLPPVPQRYTPLSKLTPSAMVEEFQKPQEPSKSIQPSKGKSKAEPSSSSSDSEESTSEESSSEESSSDNRTDSTEEKSEQPA